MIACVCVDYLTHDWDSNDIIQANHEIRKQLHQIKTQKELSDDTKEQKSIQIEHDRLIRFQNAIWRQMARICTNRLGQSNAKISPSTVNWQKESDITWLYGPFYTTKLTSSAPSALSSTTTSSTKGIKSALKKPAPTSLGVNSYRPWSKTCSEPGASPISVRFNPDIEQLEYLPESPVEETMTSDSDYWSLNDEEDEEDDILWSMAVNLSQIVKNKATSLISSLLSSPSPSSSSITLSTSTYKQHPQQHNTKHQYQHHYQQQNHHHHQQQQQISNLAISSDITRETPLHIILLFLSMTKSFTSLIGTWFMYQSLLPFTWLIKHHHSQKNHHHTTF